MGHFYRALTLVRGLAAAGEKCMVYINDHATSLGILAQQRVPYRVVDLQDFTGRWEAALVARDGIRLWVNDRLDTDARHAANVKATGVPLATFDDHGQGAALADLHIAGMCFNESEPLAGKVVLRGVKYMVLNPDIADHVRLRKSLGSILVTLGGSDTYGVTVKVVQALGRMGLAATVVVGPGFGHIADLQRCLGEHFILKRGVPSMIEEFSFHDMAITGGGITPFEANASGLPCVVIANELFEIPVGRELERLGSSVFAGHHESLRARFFDPGMRLEPMSRAGLANIGLDGTQRVVFALLELVRERAP